MNLKVFRAAHDLSQQEMADKLGIARSTYSMVERGERQAGMKIWNRFMEKFGLTPDEIYELLMEVDSEEVCTESGKEAARHD